jgi:hypothetical protein
MRSVLEHWEANGDLRTGIRLVGIVRGTLRRRRAIGIGLDDTLQNSMETQRLPRIVWTYAEILHALHAVAPVTTDSQEPDVCWEHT